MEEFNEGLFNDERAELKAVMERIANLKIKVRHVKKRAKIKITLKKEAEEYFLKTKH